MKQVEVTGTLRTQWVECITDILNFYIQFCNKHKLRYFVAYGTAIGAARHHGIIPWDDDIDVVMPRPDFEKFKQLCQTEDLGKYELISPFNTPNYYLPFYKLCNKETTLLEKDEYRCIIGMFIDIFVYDGMVNDKTQFLKLQKKYTKYWNRLTLVSTYYKKETIINKLKSGRFKDMLHYFLINLNRKQLRRFYLKKLQDVVNTYNYDEQQFITKYPPGYGDKELIPKSWIEESTLLPYDGLQVAIPKNYTRWLNNYFDDYTQLPPIEQRHAQHSIAYVNFKQRETIDEVLRKVTS